MHSTSSTMHRMRLHGGNPLEPPALVHDQYRAQLVKWLAIYSGAATLDCIRSTWTITDSIVALT